MITEEEGKLIRKVELTEEEIRAEIKSEEASIQDTLDRIEMYKGYLPVEELVEEVNESEVPTEDTPQY